MKYLYKIEYYDDSGAMIARTLWKSKKKAEEIAKRWKGKTKPVITKLEGLEKIAAERFIK